MCQAAKERVSGTDLPESEEPQFSRWVPTIMIHWYGTFPLFRDLYITLLELVAGIYTLQISDP